MLIPSCSVDGVLGVTDNVKALAEREENSQPHQTEEFEVDPYGFAEIEGNREIQDAEKNEKESVLTISASPNPFNYQITIKYVLPHMADVELEIYNTLGQRVQFFSESQKVGDTHIIRWDGTNQCGGPVASGVYFCTIKRDGEYVAGMRPLKMLLLK